MTIYAKCYGIGRNCSTLDPIFLHEDIYGNIRKQGSMGTGKYFGKQLAIVIIAIIAFLAVFTGIRRYNMPENRLAKLLDLGYTYLLEQNYEEAVLVFELAIMIDPKNMEAYVGGLEAYQHLNVGERMQVFYEKALEAVRGMDEGLLTENMDYVVTIYLAAGNVYKDRPEKMLEVLEEGYQIAPENTGLKEYIQSNVDTPDIQTETNSYAPELFEQLPSDFTFSSGMGGWYIDLDLNTDGSFTGEYYDMNMGETGKGYSGGTVYICDFEGRFSVPEQMDEYRYSMKLEYLKSLSIPGDEYYEDDVRYICEELYGLAEADIFQIYLPGCPIADVAEEYISWWGPMIPLNGEKFPDGYYGIYNINAETGFLGLKESDETEADILEWSL